MGLGLAHRVFDRSNVMLAPTVFYKFSTKDITLLCRIFGTPMGNRSERSERNSGTSEFTHVVKRQPSVLGFVQRSCVRVNAQ